MRIRRFRGGLAVLLVLGPALATGCSRTRPASAIVAVGRFAYEGSYTESPGAAPRSFRGFLVVTELTGDRLSGRWEVDGFDPEVQLGTFANGAYNTNADVVGDGVRGTFQHRLRRGSRPGELECTAVFLARTGDTATSLPATCTLTPAPAA